jgi:hypothetical protein
MSDKYLIHSVKEAIIEAGVPARFFEKARAKIGEKGALSRRTTRRTFGEKGAARQETANLPE